MITPHSMDAYSTKAKEEDKRRLLIERRAKLRVLLDNEMKQLEVHVYTRISYSISQWIAASNIYTRQLLVIDTGRQNDLFCYYP